MKWCPDGAVEIERRHRCPVLAHLRTYRPSSSTRCELLVRLLGWHAHGAAGDSFSLHLSQPWHCWCRWRGAEPSRILLAQARWPAPEPMTLQIRSEADAWLTSLGISR